MWPFSLATLVDELVASGSFWNFLDAVFILEDPELHLRELWSLHFSLNDFALMVVYRFYTYLASQIGSRLPARGPELVDVRLGARADI